MEDKKWIVVMVLSLVAISSSFWGFPVYILDEAKNATCAMEMLQRGDWVVPTFNGQLRTDKPPLHYFFMMASYSIFGVTPFAARLFSVIMGMLTVGVVYRYTRRLEGERMAFVAGLTLASSFFFIAQFHLAVPDPYFIFFLTLCWLSFASGLRNGKASDLYVSYSSLALAFLAKGPAAVALTVLVLVPYLGLTSGFSRESFRRTKALAGLGLFLLIAVPWWIAVAWQTKGAWVSDFIWSHNVGRFLTPYEGHTSIPGMAVVMFFISLIPLSVLIPRAMYQGWMERGARPLILLAMLAVAAVVIFFTLSSTFLPNYVGPAVPFGAILIAYAVERWIRKGQVTRLQWRLSIGAALVLAAVVPVLYIAITRDQWIGDVPELALYFLPWPAGALVYSWFLRKGDIHKAVVAWFVGFWLAGVMIFYGAVPRIMAHNPVIQSLEIVQQTDREVIGYRFFNAAYLFALQKPLPTFWTPAEVLNYTTGGKPVMVLSRADYENELVEAGFKVIFRHPYLFEGSTALILVNEPR